jgi:beta-N-acetylhexosaminidase
MYKISLIVLLTAMLACASKPVEEQPQTKYTNQELGQLLVVGFRGTEINSESKIVKDIKEYNLGGVVLFDFDIESGEYGRNITNANQLLKLSSALVAYSQTPPIIAIDQEGGRVSRLKETYGFPKTRSAQYLGTLDNEDSTRYYAKTTAQEFMVVGVNTNFAPVVDVNLNPSNPVIGNYERSFSKETHKVVKHVGYVLDEFDKEGILSVLKHFPGHGSSTKDSHLGVTDVTNIWDESELLPYKKLFTERKINAVMTAHIYNARLDSLWPATLSERTIQGILRDSLGFNGVVFSDDMQMKAISDEYGLETAIEQSLNAGIDILVFANNLVYEEDIARKAIQIIQKGIAEGRISETKIDSALARVGRLKKEVIEDLCTCLTY